MSTARRCSGVVLFPSFEEGWLRPINKMARYLKQGAAGEVKMPDLPGRADSKVAFRLLDRRDRPSSKEGKMDSRKVSKLQSIARRRRREICV